MITDLNTGEYEADRTGVHKYAEACFHSEAYGSFLRIRDG
jgi:hypothetical protein